MDLIKITDLTNQLGISSRSLRYYEQAGLIESVRLNVEKYRYYDDKNIERLKQIMVLRKMQIPDINKLYEHTAKIWNNDNGKDLEALGGGFNVTLEALQDSEKRSKIAAKIREVR